MDIIDKHFTKYEREEAINILKELDPVRFSESDYYAVDISNKEFDSAFSGNKIRKSRFTSCKFNEVIFYGTAGTSSAIVGCEFIGCTVENAGFDFVDFTSTHFGVGDSITKIESSGFAYSNFSDSKILNVICSGSNFDNAYFNRTLIKNARLKHCKFENAHFINVSFENVDLSNLGFEFALFENINMNNAVLPYMGVLQSFNLLQEIYKQPEMVSLKFPDSEITISAQEFFKHIDKLQSYFYEKRDFFVLANINIFMGNQKQSFMYIMMGLNDSIEKSDFRMIRYLCKLASTNHFFTRNQLREIYEYLNLPKITERFNHHDYQIYFHEMDKIKRVLIDNPFELPQIVISVKTTIPAEDSENAGLLIASLSKFIDLIAPQSINYLTLRHNSPNIIEIFSSDNLNALYNTMAVLAFICLGVSSTVFNLRNEFIGYKTKKLDYKDKEIDYEFKKKSFETRLEREMLETEKLRKEVFSQNESECYEKLKLASEQNIENDLESFYLADIIPETVKRQISSLSFSIKTDSVIPIELRSGSITRENSEIYEKEGYPL